MNPDNIPFNALIVGATNCGKTSFLVEILNHEFLQKFDYIFLVCPTFAHNKTYDGFAENDRGFFVIIPEQNQINDFLKLISFAFEGTNTLIILDDCAASKDVKIKTNELVNLAFSARHKGISVWVLTQQMTSIAKAFRENIACLVLFYSPSAYFLPLDREKLLNNLKKDFMVKRELYTIAGGLYLRYGSYMAAASAALLTLNNLKLEDENLEKIE